MMLSTVDRDELMDLIRHANAAGAPNAWERNPWVWALTFKEVEASDE